MNGCSGSSTATNPMSPYAASRWFTSARVLPSSIRKKSSEVMPHSIISSGISPGAASWWMRPFLSPMSRWLRIRAWPVKAASISRVTPRSGAGSARAREISACRHSGDHRQVQAKESITVMSSTTIRPARRDDVAAIIAMLADDHLGRARERLEDPLPDPYYQAFERVSTDPNIDLVVAEEGGRVVGCLQLCILPGLSSQGASRGLIEDVRVASDR